MNKNDLIFTLNTRQKIIAEIDNIYEVHCCYEAPIFLIEKNHKILLSIDSLRENMTIFKNMLNKALIGSLTLHSSIKNDIGLLYNEES